MSPRLVLCSIVWERSSHKHTHHPVIHALMLWPHCTMETTCASRGCGCYRPVSAPPTPPLPPCSGPTTHSSAPLSAPGSTGDSQAQDEGDLLVSPHPGHLSLPSSSSSSHSGAQIQAAIFHPAAPAMPGGTLLQTGSQAYHPLCATES